MNELVNQVEQFLQDFESAWESGIVADFESAIPPQARSNTELLTDLVCVDLQNRIQRDLNTRVESYTTKFPELARDDLVLLELIRTEYTFHPRRESIDAKSYCERFPHLATQIEMMFRIEFRDSKTAVNHRQGTDFQCVHCDTVITGRDKGETRCHTCGQPVNIGRYELIQRVGQGAFGYVYRARDPKLDREVAVKIPRSDRFLMPEESERFFRESRNAAQLDHPGIVRIFDTGRHDGIPFIVSEFVQGRPLSVLLSNREFEFRETASVVARIAGAVGHAHERGVIHRDLKPANIMTSEVDDQLQPRVMDFGLARRDQKDVTVTIEGQAIGTPAYMSPEQALGDLTEVGPQSDVYSLGVILYQLLCGEVPFRGNVQKLIQQVIHDDPSPPSRYRSRIPRDLETICMKAINRMASGRYSSANELRDDLQRWLDGKPIEARPVGAIEKLWRWSNRRPTVAALLCVLAVSLFAGVAGITWQWREADVARKASEADLNDALESVDRVLGHLGSNRLADIPQAKQLRADVLADSLVFFQRFRQRNPDDPRLAMQVAKAHYQVARIQNALGQYVEAGKAYQAATDEYERIEYRAPDHQQWLESTSQAYSAYASFLLNQSDRGQAEQQQAKCLELRERLYIENPKSTKFAAKYASARADLGRIFTDPEDVEREFELAINLLEQIASVSTAIGVKQDLARVLNNYSIYLSKVSKHGKAEKSRERAIELYELVVADDPQDETKRSQYANCCLQLVKNLRTETRQFAAGKYQEKAIAAYRGLTEDFPATPRHRERFARVLREVAMNATVQKRHGDAVEAFQEAVRQHEILVAMFPSNSRYPNLLADDLSRLSKALVQLDRNEDAEFHLRQRLQMLRKLFANGTDRHNIQLAVAIRDLEILLSKSDSKKHSKEVKALRSEVEHLLEDLNAETILATDLTNREKRGLISPLMALAKKENNTVAIERLYRARIQLYEDDLQIDPDNIPSKGSLARQWRHYGRFLKDQDQQDDAVESLRNALALNHELVAADPDSSKFATQLLLDSITLSHMLYFSEQAEEAIEVIRPSLELAKSLYEEHQNEAYRQRFVVIAYLQLGDALSSGRLDYVEALAAYEEAVSLRDCLAKQPDMEKFEAMVLNKTAWFLVSCPDESLRNPDRALTLAHMAVDIAPNSSDHVSTLGFAFYESGEFKKAIESLRQANELSDIGAALNTMLIASAQARLTDFKNARDSFDEAIRLNEINSSEPDLFAVYRARTKKLLDEDGQDQNENTGSFR